MNDTRELFIMMYEIIRLLLICVIINGCASVNPPPDNSGSSTFSPLVQTELEPVQHVDITQRIMQKPTGIYHTVQKGETLWRISQQYMVTVDAIASYNRLPDVSTISEGQRLFIPQNQKGRLVNQTALAAIPREKAFIWPVEGSVLYRFNEMVAGSANKGIDITVSRGTPIYAAKSGIVSFVGTDVKGLGNMVVIDHYEGIQTVYAYNDDNVVTVGNRVTQGDLIGHVGSGGRAVGPSLHFEIRNNSIPHDPLSYLPKK